MGDRGRFCGRTLFSDGQDAVDRRVTEVMRVGSEMGVLQCVDQRTGENSKVAIPSVHRRRIGKKPRELMFRGRVVTDLYVDRFSQQARRKIGRARSSRSV